MKSWNASRKRSLPEFGGHGYGNLSECIIIAMKEFKVFASATAGFAAIQQDLTA
jgi:hypothetical protein